MGGLHVQPGGRTHRHRDPERLPGHEAVVRVADCTRMIVKALREGEHHALLLQVRLKDNPRAARPGVWPAAAHPADLELQLAVPTTVYHWLQAFHDLQWRGKPNRRIGATHWQPWLQADAQRDAIRSLGPAPATRALDAAAPGRALAPHTVPLANLPFEPATEGAIRKSVPLPLARGATEPTKCPLCADKYYKSEAMLEHLAWHAVHAAAPVDDKEAASDILQGRALKSPWHASYARRPPPQAADHADGDEEAPGAAPETGGAAQQGSIPASVTERRFSLSLTDHCIFLTIQKCYSNRTLVMPYRFSFHHAFQTASTPVGSPAIFDCHLSLFLGYWCLTWQCFAPREFYSGMIYL